MAEENVVAGSERRDDHGGEIERPAQGGRDLVPRWVGGARPRGSHVILDNSLKYSRMETGSWILGPMPKESQ